MPMVLYTFLENNDLFGKTIVPFCTYGSSGFSNTIQTIAELQPKANVNKNGFAVSRKDLLNCANSVKVWLNECGLKK